ncbi:hypothetical protein [Spiroplasma sp. SV19]|uniref:hypothetical protein n=1 Tax=Spiroplasma sp. SV19 TaxID=2570468 RepID=UPI0024B708DA|nr:hypothetical protein [Spiroplasma sp. SV19]WHQ36954.1 hypothetical protein E7Y35_03525 [Spiroplasma sp. SV19]
MSKYELHKYFFKGYDQDNNVQDILYLDVQKYQYQPQVGIKVITKNKKEYLIKNYWFNYDKPDPDDKFKFECFECDLHRILFLNEWQQDKEAFIDKHYLPLEKFNILKEQKQKVLAEYLLVHGATAKDDSAYRSLEASFSLLKHKPRTEVEQELTEMAEYYAMDMKEFDKLKQANSMLAFEAIALDLYGDPLLFEEVTDEQSDFLLHNEDF